MVRTAEKQSFHLIKPLKGKGVQSLEAQKHEVIKKLYLLFLVDVTDAFLTYAGITAGKITEANPLVENIVHNLFLLFSIKVFLPFTAIFAVLKFFKTTAGYFTKLTVLLLDAVIFIYTAVLFLHAYWIFTTS